MDRAGVRTNIIKDFTRGISMNKKVLDSCMGVLDINHDWKSDRDKYYEEKKLNTEKPKEDSNYKKSNKVQLRKENGQLKTVQEILCEIDPKEIEQEIFSSGEFNIFNSELDSEMTIGELKENLSLRLHNFLRILKETPKEDTEKHMILFASTTIGQYGYKECSCNACFIEDLVKADDVKSVQTYDFIDSSLAEAVGYFVADTVNTKNNLLEIVCEFIRTLTYFGFDEETRKNNIKQLHYHIPDEEQVEFDTWCADIEVDSEDGYIEVGNDCFDEVYYSAYEMVSKFEDDWKRKEMLTIKEDCKI